jgi:hypothetical protein
MTRDDKGRFAQGNPGGGRKPKATEERYLELMKSTVSEADWTAIIARAVVDAKRGDTAARKFIADYLIGPPVEKKQIDANVNAEVVLKTIKGVSVDSL